MTEYERGTRERLVVEDVLPKEIEDMGRPSCRNKRRGPVTSMYTLYQKSQLSVHLVVFRSVFWSDLTAGVETVKRLSRVTDVDYRGPTGEGCVMT